jgi:hypothetical protein
MCLKYNEKEMLLSDEKCQANLSFQFGFESTFLVYNHCHIPDKDERISNRQMISPNCDLRKKHIDVITLSY